MRKESKVFHFFAEGGLYYAISKEKAVLEEDMELITLLPKGTHFQDDLKEILKFVAEDLNSLGLGLLLA